MVLLTLKFIYIVLEFYKGIQLFNKIIDQTKLNKDKNKLNFY